MLKHQFRELRMKSGDKSQADSLKGKTVSVSNAVLPRSHKWVSIVPLKRDKSGCLQPQVTPELPRALWLVRLSLLVSRVRQGRVDSIAMLTQQRARVLTAYSPGVCGRRAAYWQGSGIQKWYAGRLLSQQQPATAQSVSKKKGKWISLLSIVLLQDHNNQSQLLFCINSLK